MDPFAALADATRRDLLRQLSHGPARVVDLAARHRISRPAVSKHLRLLTEAGLVSATDQGRERHYRLEAGALRPVTELLTELERAPRVPAAALDALELEVRRVGRDRRGRDSTTTPSQEETA